MAAQEFVQFGSWDLFEVATAVGEGGLDAYLQTVLGRCSEWFMARRASIFLRKPGTTEYELAAVWGSYARRVAGASLHEGVGIAGLAIQEGQPRIVGDPSLVSKELKRKVEISSSIIVPLVTPQQEKIGVLNLARASGQPPFADSDLHQAQALGRTVGLAVGNARLFSQLHESMAEAIDLQAMLQSVVETVGSGMMVIDANAVVTHCNAVAREYLGIDRPFNTPLSELIESVHAPFRSAIKSTAPASLLGERTKARVEEPLTARTWTLIGQPAPGGGATLAIQETTEQERALAELQRTKRLAEIGQMTAAIAHEIRNPLTGILSAAQVVQSDAESAPEFGRIIEEEARKLNCLCNDFLEFAKPIQLNRQLVRLGDIAKTVIDHHRPEFEARQVELSLQLPSIEPILFLDSIRIDQVIRNLVLNALQASCPGGSVIVRVGERTLSVEDQGQGMNQGIQERLFTPFFTTKPQGTGLGLSNVRKIVDAHGAKIEVRSAPDSGSLFEITFPAQEPA